jgi:hypothetical protein
MPQKCFHFQEINWTITFPAEGNKGKYSNYTVTLNKGTQPEAIAKLGEILESPEIEQQYPHTVGYYKTAFTEHPTQPFQYLELRRIKTVEEFWLFLNCLDL